MKNLFVIIVAMLFCGNVFSQGINFEHGTFTEALAKAKAENKPMFIDVFTSWCGPCKKLSKEVFTQKAVGDYFNKSFVSFKLQTDKKETDNKEIADRYHVTAYPTLMWVDGEGELLHLAVGFHEVDKLLTEAKKVFDEDKRVGSSITKWNNGDHSLSVAMNYFAFDKNSKGEFEEYFKGLSEKQKLDSLTFEMISDVRLDTDGDVFAFVVRHRKDYQKVAYDFKIGRAIDQEIDYELQSNFGTEKYKEIVLKYKQIGFDELGLFMKRAEWKYYLNKSDFLSFEKSAVEYLQEFSKPNNYLRNELVWELYGVGKEKFSKFNNPDLVLDWANEFKKKMIEPDQFCYPEFYAYVIAGDINRAKKIGNDYLKSTEGKSDYSSVSTREYVQYLLSEIK
ncbi:hypothetical protein BZG01_16190 [Labilibaculum manganireducens]|uniref:Thioredoxin domain-containing protein n=1 Tax=Labilibaculum manganireducens TaxID=1940525 RepID=A0A2N3HYY5_9BACT|nr:thioredoxin fold domain-containing protein [Labilibaculum manganireducens]PKQ63261.1 hypothetical protein BZG01_16190 [Labilibaculum manganireducens]